MADYTPNIHFTLEKHLETYAACDKNTKPLLESFHTVEKSVSSFLKPVISAFPHYSDHSDSHSRNIIAALEQLLGEKRIQMLSAADTWAILVSAYLHDIGMVVMDEELRKDWATQPFQQHLKRLQESGVGEMQDAARRMAGSDWMQKQGADWPVVVKRDVILLASDYYRGKHPERAEDNTRVMQAMKMLDFTMSSGGEIHPRVQETIVRICQAHGGSFAEMLGSLVPCDSVCGYNFHPRFVAAMLRLGDLCDMDNGRFNMAVVRAFGGLSTGNYEHYLKHEAVRTFSIREDNIQICMDVVQSKVKDALPKDYTEAQTLDVFHRTLLETRRWLGWMEQEIENIKLHWQELSDGEIVPMSPKLEYRILTNGKESVISDVDMKFQFSNEKAYTLIEGYSLYDDQLTFVRELVQNSLDALKMQMWRDIQSGRWDHLLGAFYDRARREDGSVDFSDLQPFDFSDTSVYEAYRVKVKMTHKEGEKTAVFTIEDNGTGISQKDLKTRILKTGGSWHNDSSAHAEMEGMPGWLLPTGSFGIGLHSVFVLADSIRIWTRTEYDPTVYDILLHSGKQDGYVFMNASEQQNKHFCGGGKRGTAMRIELNLEKYRGKSVDGMEDIENDPMAPRPESDFCADIEEEIVEKFQSPLFYVEFDCDNGPEKRTAMFCTHAYFSQLFDSEKRNRLYQRNKEDCYYFEESYDYAFYNFGRGIVVWSTEKRMAFYFNFAREDFTNICCKGITVCYVRLPSTFPWLSFTQVDFLGGDSGKLLNAARDALRGEVAAELQEDMREVYAVVARIYRELACKLMKDKDIQAWRNGVKWAVLGEGEGKIKHTLSTRFVGQAIKNLTSKFARTQDDKKVVELCAYLWGLNEIFYFLREDIHSFTDGKLSLNRKNIAKEEKIREWAVEGVKIFKENPRIRPFISILFKSYSRNIVRAFGNALGRAFGGKFVDMFGNAFGNALGNIFIREFDSEFDMKFCSTFGDDFGYAFSHAFDGEFGSEIDSELEGDVTGGIISKFDSEFHNLLDQKNWGNPYQKNSLNSYFAIPIISIGWLLLATQQETEIFFESTEEEWVLQPGFQDNWGFLRVHTVLDILTSPILEIDEDQFQECKIKERLTVFSYIPCESLSIGREGKIHLHFDMQNRNRQYIGYHDQKVLQMYLQKYNYTRTLPAFKKYEGIAVTVCPGNKVPLYCTNNYYLSLWADFQDMFEEYSSRLITMEDQVSLVDEIMTILDEEGWGVPNLLRYIYHYRANVDERKTYEETMREIEQTYRRFVSDVLDCVAAVAKEEAEKKGKKLIRSPEEHRVNGFTDEEDS